jgi:hypothetical protein
MMKEKKQLVASELGDVVKLSDHSFARSLYHDLASESTIDSFLKKSRSYSVTHRHWKLPRNCAKLFDNDFYTPFLNVVSSIVKHFWSDAWARSTRQVVDTHVTDLQHSETDHQFHCSRPSLVIKAEGPSFQLPRIAAGARPAGIGFSNISSCIEIQVEGEESSVTEQLLHVAVYARYVRMTLESTKILTTLALGSCSFTSQIDDSFACLFLRGGISVCFTSTAAAPNTLPSLTFIPILTLSYDSFSDSVHRTRTTLALIPVSNGGLRTDAKSAEL